MELSQQVCSLDLAKRLKKLGVKQESGFWWSPSGVGNKPQVHYTHELDKRTIHHKYLDYAAFTVAELGEMLPEFVMTIRRTEDWYCTDYMNFRSPEIGESFSAETEADARAAMLIYLIENKIINQTNL